MRIRKNWKKLVWKRSSAWTRRKKSLAWRDWMSLS